MKHTILPTLAVVAALAAACGGSSSTNTSSGAAGGGGAYSSGATATPAAKPSGATSVKTGTGSPGTFLVDAKGRTLYLWVADKGSKSTCSGACAQAWPPLTTTGKPQAGSGVEASLLGTTKRSDGTLEVTYAGHPLYYFAGDATPGQTTGQGNEGFGAYWWVVAPDGKAISNGS
jgi:predicted lipoprotein with Yx(FWY)xxD motif